MVNDTHILILFSVVGFCFTVLLIVFSAAQIAYLSLPENFQKETSKKNDKDPLIQHLLEKEDSLFFSIRIAKLFVTIGFIVCMAFLFFAAGKVTIVSILLSFVLLVFGLFLIFLLTNEFGAKIFILNNPLKYAKLTYWPVRICVYLCEPFVKGLIAFQNVLVKKYDLTSSIRLFNRHNLMTFVENEEQISLLEDNEREMIYSIYEFGETEVHEVMIPRTDIVSVEETINIHDFKKIISERGHSRIPLYHEDVDNILGVIHVKDLLLFDVRENSATVDLKKLARPAHFVPENKKLHDLLKEFQKEKHHMAIVVDEYGGTAGLITLEDIIEEIVGDIQDEYDQEGPLYRKLNEYSYSVDAKIDLHELNEELEIELPTEGEYESLGGFILSLTGHVPKVNEVIKYRQFTFKIESVVQNRIICVILTIARPQEIAENAGNQIDE